MSTAPAEGPERHPSVGKASHIFCCFHCKNMCTELAMTPPRLNLVTGGLTLSRVIGNALPRSHFEGRERVSTAHAEGPERHPSVGKASHTFGCFHCKNMCQELIMTPPRITLGHWAWILSRVLGTRCQDLILRSALSGPGSGESTNLWLCAASHKELANP